MDELLEELGLTKLEIKIFEFLLDNGPSIVGDVARKTGIHRRNSYDALERLIQKGLVSYIKENNVKQYEASSPDVVYEKLKSRLTEWEEVMPDLEEKRKQWDNKKETLFFRGISGIKHIFFDQIEVGEEVLVHATNMDTSSVLKYFFPKYQNLRKENNIKTRMIFDESFKADLSKMKKLPLCKIKMISGCNSTDTSQYIYGDNVAIVRWSSEPFAILIRDKEISKSFREKFEVFWDL